MNGLIYKATSPSGKVYIGQTINFKKRIKSHKKESFGGNSREYNLSFHRAIRKYKFENIVWEILIENLFNKENMDMWERWYIFDFESNNPRKGYNETFGGEGFQSGKNHPRFGKKFPEISKKMSGVNNPCYGKKRPEHALLMSERFKGENNPMKRPEIRAKISGEHSLNYKRQYSSEERIKLSRANGGKGPFVCVETNQIFQTQNEAARTLNVNQSCVSYVLRGRIKSTGNFHFKYLENNTCSENTI